jgi:hypothetical protein
VAALSTTASALARLEHIDAVERGVVDVAAQMKAVPLRSPICATCSSGTSSAARRAIRVISGSPRGASAQIHADHRAIVVAASCSMAERWPVDMWTAGGPPSAGRQRAEQHRAIAANDHRKPPRRRLST